jgi:hypothetical protein
MSLTAAEKREVEAAGYTELAVFAAAIRMKAWHKEVP